MLKDNNLRNIIFLLFKEKMFELRMLNRLNQPYS